MNKLQAIGQLKNLWEKHLATHHNHALDKDMKLGDIHVEIEMADTFLAGLVSTFLQYGNLEKCDNPDAPLRPKEILDNILADTERIDKELVEIKLNGEDQIYRKNFRTWNLRLINMARLLKECL